MIFIFIDRKIIKRYVIDIFFQSEILFLFVSIFYMQNFWEQKIVLHKKRNTLRCHTIDACHLYNLFELQFFLLCIFNDSSLNEFWLMQIEEEWNALGFISYLKGDASSKILHVMWWQGQCRLNDFNLDV